MVSHPGQARLGESSRVESEYTRGVTLAYMAAYDVHHAKVFGQIAPKTGIDPFTQLVAEVMTTEPYAAAKRAFWVVDNGSSHNGWRSVLRIQDAWPNAMLVHLPVHASWLNQIEIYFSILQRKSHQPDRLRQPRRPRRTHPEPPRAVQHHNRALRLGYSREDLNNFLTRLTAA